MSLGPEDLPEDPFGEGGMSQVICGCTSEVFHFILTRSTVKAVCARCKRVNGEWPAVLRGSPQMHTDQASAHTEGPSLDQITAHRDVPPDFTQPPAGYWWIDEEGGATHIDLPGAQAGAGWGIAEVDVSQGGRTERVPGRAEPPPLPAFSPAVCNAYLRGGPYDKRITWVMDGSAMLHVRGVGSYLLTGESIDGRAVYDYKPPGKAS